MNENRHKDRPGVADEGFWRLTEDHLSAILARNDLSWESARVYLALAYLTVGYRKPKDRVSIGQIAEIARMDHRAVIRGLGKLKHAGLYDQKETGPRSVIRWPIWPAPKGPGRRPRFRAEKKPAASSTSSSTSPSTAAGSVLADSVKGSVLEDTRGSVNDSVLEDTLPETQKNRDPLSLREGATPAAPGSGDFALTSTEEASENGDRGRLIGQWADRFQAKTGNAITEKARGRVAKVMRSTLADFRADDLAAAIDRYFAQDRQSYSPELFAKKMQDGDADVTGRAVNQKPAPRPATYTPAATGTTYETHAKQF